MVILIEDPNNFSQRYCMIDLDLNTWGKWHPTIEDALTDITTNTIHISYHNWTLEDWQEEYPNYTVTEYNYVLTSYEYW